MRDRFIGRNQNEIFEKIGEILHHSEICRCSKLSLRAVSKIYAPQIRSYSLWTFSTVGPLVLKTYYCTKHTSRQQTVTDRNVMYSQLLISQKRKCFVFHCWLWWCGYGINSSDQWNLFPWRAELRAVHSGQPDQSPSWADDKNAENCKTGWGHRRYWVLRFRDSGFFMSVWLFRDGSFIRCSSAVIKDAGWKQNGKYLLRAWIKPSDGTGYPLMNRLYFCQ